MAATTWPTPNWPEGVANDVSGYEKPLFSILDDTVNEYPNQVYTIFNDAISAIFYPHLCPGTR